MNNEQLIIQALDKFIQNGGVAGSVADAFIKGYLIGYADNKPAPVEEKKTSNVKGAK